MCAMSDHEHAASVYARCPDCLTWGVPMPGDRVCGNCGGGSTVPYVPPCCLDAIKERIAELETERGKHALDCAQCGVTTWWSRPTGGITTLCGACTCRNLEEERDEALAHLALAERVIAEARAVAQKGLHVGDVEQRARVLQARLRPLRHAIAAYDEVRDE